jgi:hypothetical protein
VVPELAVIFAVLEPLARKVVAMLGCRPRSSERRRKEDANLVRREARGFDDLRESVAVPLPITR